MMFWFWFLVNFRLTQQHRYVTGCMEYARRILSHQLLEDLDCPCIVLAVTIPSCMIMISRGLLEYFDFVTSIFLFLFDTLKLTVQFFCFCSYALFDMDGNQVPQELVTQIGVTFERILEEVCPSHSFRFLLYSYSRIS